jgi:DNA gyrase subunit A
MSDFAKTVVPIRIEDEMQNSYMDYSMSVIIGRALPDVRDGLKPVHRRVLYAMYREGLLSSRKYSKCAGVVGEVLKKYHPHGDASVYDALVRMAQPWNLRYLLVDGQGNFGSVDGDPAAAYRYTECRMTALAEEMLTDIDKDTVAYSPNFDGATEEPDVLPSKIPNLLVNGADGIAVGMATKIPPHNLREIIDACIAVIDTPEITLDELMMIVPGPDFPTGGLIYGRSGVRAAYESGRGRIVVRGVSRFEEVNGRTAIVIDELPYQVNKARLIEQIAELVKDKKLEGIHALRDESDRTGMRVVIELKHDVFEEVVLNHLYKHTQLQLTYGVILLAIVNQRPRILSLREMISLYVAHRREVVLRRTRYELAEAKRRAHILEGYRIALDHLDEVITLIRHSANPAEAKEGLQTRFGLSEIQAAAILELRLQRLTGMERQKIQEEYDAIQVEIGRLEAILASEALLMGVVKDELREVRDRFGDNRRTRFVDGGAEVRVKDLVAEEDQIVTLSRLGYIKRCNPDAWRIQARGGFGKKGMATREEDFVTTLFVANTHSTLLVFTTSGKVYPLNVYEVPEAGAAAKGRPIVNLVNLAEGEQVASVTTVDQIGDDDNTELFFIARSGLMKRTPLEKFRNLRSGGMIAAGVAEGDQLMKVRRVDQTDTDFMVLTEQGRCIRYRRHRAPLLGRDARGNRSIKLSAKDRIVDALLVPPTPEWDTGEADSDVDPDVTIDEPASDLDDEDVTIDEPSVLAADPNVETLLTVTANGYGKRTPFEQYRTQNPNGKGILSYRVTRDTGGVVGSVEVLPTDNVMLVTNTGRVIRILASSVRRGRSGLAGGPVS